MYFDFVDMKYNHMNWSKINKKEIEFFKKEIRDDLDLKLISNDINIVSKIFSYLGYICEECIKYNDAEETYQKVSYPCKKHDKCKLDGKVHYKIEKRKICKKCFIEIMYKIGKNGIKKKKEIYFT
jgi:ribosomal protein S14